MKRSDDRFPYNQLLLIAIKISKIGEKSNARVNGVMFRGIAKVNFEKITLYPFFWYIRVEIKLIAYKLLFG